jgi:hypothetical protein
MDRLAARLRADAEGIEAIVSPELDARIQASLHGIVPGRPRPREPVTRLFRFRWEVLLTGTALAAAAIIAMNMRAGEPGFSATEPDLAAIEPPAVPWRVEPAVLTSPLEQEYADIRSDLKKAGQAVRAEIEAVF